MSVHDETCPGQLIRRAGCGLGPRPAEQPAGAGAGSEILHGLGPERERRADPAWVLAHGVDLVIHRQASSERTPERAPSGANPCGRWPDRLLVA